MGVNMLSENRFNSIISSFSHLQPILVVGDVGIDRYILGRVERISPEAPVPIIDIEQTWDKLGLAANVSDNLSSLKIPSILCSIRGDDREGEHLSNLLKKKGLEDFALINGPSRYTTLKKRIITESQQICRIDHETRTPITKEIEGELLETILSFKNHSGALIIEDYGKGLFTSGLLGTLIQEFNKAEIPIYADPSGATPPLDYKGVTLLKPNKREALSMIRSLGHSPEKWSQQEINEHLAQELHIKQVVVTLGKEGMALYDCDRTPNFQIIPTVSTEVFDVSGAGDTAIALLAASLQVEAALTEAAWMANCGAACVVAKRGTNTVTTDELKAAYKKWAKNTTF